MANRWIVDDAWKLTPARHPNFDPWSGLLALPELGGPEGNVVCGRLGRDSATAPCGGFADQDDRPGDGDIENTVKDALACDEPPRYRRARKGSIVDEVEPRIRELLRAYPRIPATVIAERIGWDRSIRVLSARVAELRPVYLPPDPASRTQYVAGEIAQCDVWFSPIELAVGFGQTRSAKQLPVLTMVCAYSRWLLAMRCCRRGVLRICSRAGGG